MNDILAHYIVDIIDTVTIVVIFFSFCYAVFEYVRYYLSDYLTAIEKGKPLSIDQNRLKLGQNLLFALEVLICADVILSVIEPTMEHLTQLGIIVVIRILIAHFLQKEIDEIERLQKFHGEPPYDNESNEE